MIEVSPVDRRSELREFVRLPRRLYGRFPEYIPPLDYERRKLLHPAHGAFFKNGRARYWIARQGGIAVGRISAQVDSFAPNGGGGGIGAFGCLDAIDDGDVVAALLERAARWLEGNAMARMRGPFTLSINGESGLQIDGQGHRPMTWMPWHPAYLAPHVVAAGLSGVKDLLVYALRQAPAEVRLPGGLLKRIKVRELALRHLDRDAEIMRSLFNSAWQHNWGFLPLTSAETTALCRSFRPFLHKQCALFVEQDGTPIAFGLFVPNLFDIVGDLDGTLLPLNWLRFAWRVIKPAYRSGRIVLLGVRDDIQHTVLGAALPMLLINEALRRWPRRIEEVEMGWVLEDNARVLRVINAVGCVLTKRYRLYEKPLRPAAAANSRGASNS